MVSESFRLKGAKLSRAEMKLLLQPNQNGSQNSIFQYFSISDMPCIWKSIGQQIRRKATFTFNQRDSCDNMIGSCCWIKRVGRGWCFLFDFFARFPLLVTQISLEDLSRTGTGTGRGILYQNVTTTPLLQICPKMCYYSEVSTASLPPTHQPPIPPLTSCEFEDKSDERHGLWRPHCGQCARDSIVSPPSLSEPAIHILTFFILQNTKYTHL